MRLALVTREYPPETAWGGIGKFYAVFASALRDLGHDVEVFAQGLEADCIDNSAGILVHRVVPRKWIVGPRAGGDLAGMGVEHIGAFTACLATAMLQRVRLRQRVRPFDLVEGHEHLGINALINVVGWRSLVTVTRYHTAYRSLVKRGFVNWPASRTIDWLEGLSIQSARARISASLYIDEMTREDFPRTPPCDAVIPLFSDLAPRPAPVPIAGREKLLIFVGRLMPGHKNPETASRVFSRLAHKFADWRIEFAGLDIPLENGRTAWHSCEQILAPFAGRYCYHGALAPEGLQALYRRARIALMPSGFESFGLVALEAMSAGTIPVVSSRTALPEVVGAAGVVFENGDLEDLQRKLESLMTDEERQQDLSTGGFQRARSEFCRERILARNIALFQDLVARNRRREP